MSNLHWHTEADPCLLCGVPVTPESWAGGVVGFTADEGGRWYLASEGFDGYHLGAIWCTNGPLTDEDGAIVLDEDGQQIHAPGPIFPPRGWAGKTDAELWAAVVGTDDGEEITLRTGYGVEVGFTGRYIALCDEGCEFHQPLPSSAPAALILAMRNAQTLITHLQEAK